MPQAPAATSTVATARKKQSNTTDNQSNAASKQSAVRKRASLDDPYLEKIVGLYCMLDVVDMIIKAFGKSWTDEARCYHLNKDHGHNVGTVMRVTKGKPKGMQQKLYDVAWEHTALGETTIGSNFMLEGSQIGSEIQFIRGESSSKPPQGRPWGTQRHASLNDIRELLGANASDDDSFGSAPGREMDSLPNCDAESMASIDPEEENNKIDWYLSGKTPSQAVTNEDDYNMDVDVQVSNIISGYTGKLALK
jgi:hypothetical protein